MAKVIIVKPNITPEKDLEVFEHIAYVLEKIMKKEHGINTKYTITRAN